jgi:hypothetical protein
VQYGNISAFIRGGNVIASNNLIRRVVMIGSIPHLALFAAKDIPTKEELML